VVSLIQQMQDRRQAALKRQQELRKQAARLHEVSDQQQLSPAWEVDDAAMPNRDDPYKNSTASGAAVMVKYAEGVAHASGLASELSVPKLLSMDDEDEDMDVGQEEFGVDAQMNLIQQGHALTFQAPACASLPGLDATKQQLTNGMPSRTAETGPPQVSGYFHWLSMIKMTVADDDNGYSLQALLAFLGD
jgi:hypothetical protein